MTNAERAELRRIVKDRFKLIRMQLAQREQQIRSDLEEQLAAEMEAQIKEANLQLSTLVEEARQLRSKVADHYDQFKNELEPRRGYSGSRKPGDLIGITIGEGWQPKDLLQTIQKEYNKLAEERGIAELNLVQKELELLENIATDGLESAQAKEMFAQIPVIDNLLPYKRKFSDVVELETSTTTS